MRMRLHGSDNLFRFTTQHYSLFIGGKPVKGEIDAINEIIKDSGGNEHVINTNVTLWRSLRGGDCVI